MFNNGIDDGKALILRWFPERQIYLRSGGEVSYHTFGTKTQVAIALFFASVLIWCTITLFNLIWGNNPLLGANQQIKLKTAQYERLLEDAEARYQTAQLQLDQQQDVFERAARNFQEKHAAIAEFAKQPLLSESESVFGNSSNTSGTRILMAPTIRDVHEREARITGFSSQRLNTGTSLDLPMDTLDQTQNTLLASAEMATLERIERNRSIIEATNMSIDTLLNAGFTGTGGPLINPDAETDVDETPTPRIVNIRARTYEAKVLDEAISSMPLGHPVAAENYMTSRYGIRRDPFTKRPAMHQAIDFASYRMAPIVSTAKGKVIYAGRKGGYGRVVEVDHGYGFVTRYAHLAKTYVKRGQDVEMGEKIGGMGSTGRSTSTHLHYEIQFQGKTYDPQNFLKAGRYVQQN